MKKSVVLTLVILMLLLAACGTTNEAVETVDDGAVANQTANCGDAAAGDLADLGGKEVFMAVENAYPPFNMLNDAGEGIGWDYDMGRALCEMLNCTPVFAEAAWDGIFPAMAAGEYDVLFDGVTYTDERSETVAFSCAYVVIGQVLLVRAGEARFSTAEEFSADEDLLVATQIGTTNEIVAHDFIGVDRTQSFEDFGLAVQAVLAGDADAVVIDTVTAVGFIAENPGQLEINGGITSDEQLALVFQPGSEFIDPFTAALHAMAADGSLQEINDKWFNP
ncbi:MAG: transporter substrate-binding domain-containing protein [Chloroflexota bacterium]